MFFKLLDVNYNYSTSWAGIYTHMMIYVVFDYKMDSWIFPCWIHMKEWGFVI